MSLLIYQKEWLEQFLQQEEVRILMHRLGYRDLHLERVLTRFRSRYIRYMQKKQQFPHEMGVLLGYPPEDVEGFDRFVERYRNTLPAEKAAAQFFVSE